MQKFGQNMIYVCYLNQVVMDENWTKSNILVVLFFQVVRRGSP